MKLNREGVALNAEERNKRNQNWTTLETEVTTVSDAVKEALPIAEEALGLSGNLQAQINTLVVEGDSSVEAKQARVDAKGVEAPTLKARLDAEQQATIQQLAETGEEIERVEGALNLRVNNLVIPLSPTNSNIQVTDALVSTEKNKTFPTVKDRFEETEKDFKALQSVAATVIENKVNGKGDTLSGWRPGTVAISPTKTGYFEFKTDVSVTPYYEMPIKSGDKYYISLNYFADGTAPSTQVLLALRNVGADASNRITLMGDVATPSNLSAILTATTSGDRLGFYRLGAGGFYWFNKLVLINLTETFGAGKEPSKEGMDDFINSLPEKYFAGKQYFSQVQEIADKVNELSQKIIKGDAETFANLTNAINGKGVDKTGWGGISSDFVSPTNPGYFEFKTDVTYAPFYTMPIEANQKIYVSYDYFADGSAPSSSVKLAMKNTGTDVSNAVTLPGSVVSKKHDSVLLETTAAGNRLAFYRQGVGGKYLFKNMMFLNLTKVFGAGNEPTKKAIDEFMAKFSENYFDGSQRFSLVKDALNRLSELNALVQNGGIDNYPKLLNDIKGTRQTIVFNEDNSVAKVVHKTTAGVVEREDVFFYETGFITERRTLKTGETTTLKYNLTTFETEVI